VAVYSHFARTGDAPTPNDLAHAVGVTPDAARDALEILHAHHDVVLDGRDRDRIVRSWPQKLGLWFGGGYS